MTLEEIQDAQNLQAEEAALVVDYNETVRANGLMMPVVPGELELMLPPRTPPPLVMGSGKNRKLNMLLVGDIFIRVGQLVYRPDNHTWYRYEARPEGAGDLIEVTTERVEWAAARLVRAIFEVTEILREPSIEAPKIVKLCERKPWRVGHKKNNPALQWVTEWTRIKDDKGQLVDTSISSYKLVMAYMRDTGATGCRSAEMALSAAILQKWGIPSINKIKREDDGRLCHGYAGLDYIGADPLNEQRRAEHRKAELLKAEKLRLESKDILKAAGLPADTFTCHTATGQPCTT